MPTLSFKSPFVPHIHTTAVLPCLESINAFTKSARYCTGKSGSVHSELEARKKGKSDTLGAYLQTENSPATSGTLNKHKSHLLFSISCLPRHLIMQ